MGCLRGGGDDDDDDDSASAPICPDGESIVPGIKNASSLPTMMTAEAPAVISAQVRGYLLKDGFVCFLIKRGFGR